MKSTTTRMKAIRETGAKGLTLVQPPKEGVARAAAEKNKKPRVTRRASGAAVSSISMPAPTEPAKLPQVQLLMALSTEPGLLVLFASSIEASLVSRVGLAQSLPQPWLLPADEAKRLLSHEVVEAKPDQKARVYLAFVPMVALGPADLLSGPQTFGAEVEGQGLVTFTGECKPYNKADARRLANGVLKFSRLFMEVVPQRYEPDHAFRVGLERLVHDAEQRQMQANQAQSAENLKAEIEGADVLALEHRFLLNPDDATVTKAFADRIRPADVPEGVRDLVDEVALLERVIAAGEEIRIRELGA